MKSIKYICLLLLIAVTMAVCVQADLSNKIEIKQVEVNDVQLDRTGSAQSNELKKTDELDVLVSFASKNTNLTFDDVMVTAELTGYDKSDKNLVRDTTDSFDVKPGVVYSKRLKLKLPVRFDQGQYALKITVDTPTDRVTYGYSVTVGTHKHLIEIRDVIFHPENEVKQGRVLLTTVRVKNRGVSNEEDIKVKVSIPALGISDADYIDEVGAEDCDESDEDCDDSTTSEELYMTIPDCADAGEYTVKTCLDYSDGDEEICQTNKIEVVASDSCRLPTSKGDEPTSKERT